MTICQVLSMYFSFIGFTISVESMLESEFHKYNRITSVSQENHKNYIIMQNWHLGIPWRSTFKRLHINVIGELRR